MSRKIRILKLGGSLLDWPPLPKKWNEWIQKSEAYQPTLVVVGGGAVVDAIRKVDSLHSLDPVAVHWLCVELMNSTTKLAHQILNQGQLLKDPESLENWLAEKFPQGHTDRQFMESTLAFVCPSAFYWQDLNSTALPTTWDTSSDSISALLARLVGADQLWLLKSTDSASGKQDIVDPAFEAALPEGVTVRLVNLRDPAKQ